MLLRHTRTLIIMALLISLSVTPMHAWWLFDWVSGKSTTQKEIKTETAAITVLAAAAGAIAVTSCFWALRLYAQSKKSEASPAATSSKISTVSISSADSEQQTELARLKKENQTVSANHETLVTDNKDVRAKLRRAQELIAIKEREFNQLEAEHNAEKEAGAEFRLEKETVIASVKDSLTRAEANVLILAQEAEELRNYKKNKEREEELYEHALELERNKIAKVTALNKWRRYASRKKLKRNLHAGVQNRALRLAGSGVAAKKMNAQVNNWPPSQVTKDFVMMPMALCGADIGRN